MSLPKWPEGFDAIERLKEHVRRINRDPNFGDCEECKLSEGDLCAAIDHYDAAMARLKVAVEALREINCSESTKMTGLDMNYAMAVGYAREALAAIGPLEQP